MTNLELMGMVAVRDYERQRARHLRESGWLAAMAATRSTEPAAGRGSRLSLPGLATWLANALPLRTAARAHGRA